MSKKRALQATLIISLVGVVLSGIVLSREVCHQVMEACTLGRVTEEGQLVWGYPASLFSLGMYLVLVVIAVLGLRSRE